MRILLYLVLVVSGLTACDQLSENSPQWSFEGRTMGTTYSVKIVDLPDSVDSSRLEQVFQARLQTVNGQMSTYQVDSDLSRFNRSSAVDWVTVPDALRTVVDVARSVTARTGGAFDVTVGPLVNLWGFGPGNQNPRVPAATEIEQTLQRVGARHLATRADPAALRKDRPDLYIDLSAIAKGYAVDVLANYLEGQGIADYLVEIGGEVRTGGNNRQGKPWRIAVERPLPGQRVVHRSIGLSSAAMATSGDYRNYFTQDGQSYSHTIDPRTGSPVRHRLASVSVVAETAVFADAMATALMVLGPDAGYVLAEREKIAALFIVRDGNALVEHATPAFQYLME